MISIGLAIPQFLGTGADAVSTVDQVVREAENAGVRSLWVMDGVVTDQRCVEPLVLLSYVASRTTRPRLGVAVLLLPLRSPVLLAKQLASLELVSGGRLIAGVGLGEDATPYEAFGASKRDRVARLEEGVRLMRRLWAEPRVSDAGLYGSLEDAPLEPKPVQPKVPIWFGGRTERALQRAVGLGDGWIGGGVSSTADFGQHARRVRELLAGAARDRSHFTIAKRCYLVFDRDRASATARVGPFFESIYGSAELADRVVVGGPVDACLEQLAEVKAAGADVLVLNPVVDEIENLDLLLGELMPRLAHV